MRVDRPTKYFFLIACIFSWSIWIPLALSRSEWIPLKIPLPLYFLGAFGPMIGAIFTSWKYRISNPKSLFSHLFSFKIPIHLYLAALLIPFVVYFVSISLLYCWYDDIIAFRMNEPIGVLSVFFTMIFVVVGEEFGWRGFVLPYLQKDHPALKATALVCLMWGVWHFPAFFVSGIFDSLLYICLAFFGFMFLLFPISIIFTWLHNASGGKTILAVILHAAVAAASSMTNMAITKPIPFFLVFTFVFLVVGYMLLRYYGREHLANENRTIIKVDM